MDMHARLEGVDLDYAEKQALDAGDPVPALRGAHRRAGRRVALYAGFVFATIAIGALRISSGHTPTLSFFIAPWFVLKAYEAFAERRSLADLLEGEETR